MSKKYKGMIYWMGCDFTFTGIWYPKKEETYYAVARIEAANIAEHFIRIVTESTEFAGEQHSYIISLMPEVGEKYKGKWHEVTYPDFGGYVDCEFYENHAAYFLQGIWHEPNEDGDIEHYTWMVRIEK